MMRIVFLAPIEPNGRYNGGISSFARTILNDQAFAESGIQFLPLSTCPVSRSAYTGGKLTFSNFRNLILVRRQLRKTLRENSVDCVYINTSRGFGLVKDLLLLPKRKGVKNILHVHFAGLSEVLPKNRLLSRWCLKRIKQRVNGLITLSSAMRDELVHMGMEPSKVFLIRNYYSPALKLVRPLDTNACNEEHPKVTKYLFIGSITERKGIYLLLEIFSKLDRSFDLTVCGTPNEKAGQDAMDAYSKFPNIHFLGFVAGEEKIKALSTSDVFVLPTFAEGLPISILEAMRFGLAVISTSVGAIPEIVDERIGFIVPPGDADKLRRVIQAYHDDPDLLERHRQASFKESERYSYSLFKENLINALKAI